jgi:two-component system sensor histidine kinase VicK
MHDQINARAGGGIDMELEVAANRDESAPRWAMGTGDMERVSIDEVRDGLRAQEVAQLVHDLKSPLATIALESELLGCRVSERDSWSSMSGAVQRILLNVGFIDRMVLDLLDLCVMDCGQLQLHRASTELRELVKHVVDRVIPTNDRHRVFVHAAAPAVLELDSLRIERVVANLLQNAFKYAPRVSGVTVRLDVIGDRACVSVIDAGPGISIADQAVIFDKHRRSASASAHDGFGLGLYVSKRIVEAHGGRIGVESVHGAGSRFFFELPM